MVTSLPAELSKTLTSAVGLAAVVVPVPVPVVEVEDVLDVLDVLDVEEVDAVLVGVEPPSPPPPPQAVKTTASTKPIAVLNNDIFTALFIPKNISSTNCGQPIPWE